MPSCRNVHSISGDTKLIGLLSHGASFTLSPTLHNYAAQLLQQNQVYVHFDLPSNHVESFLDVFWHLGGQGLNVTMPHKNLVASLVTSDGLTSVNTLVRTDSGWKGYSTDGEGFLRGLERASKTIHDFDVIILLGSGGAAQSILAATAKATLDRPLKAIIHRRSGENDQKIRASFSISPVSSLTYRPIDGAAFAETLKETQGLRRLVIQATSAPKHGESLESHVPALQYLSKSDLLVDLIYDNPSALYLAAKTQDVPCLDGLPMLIEQARLSQQLWWGKSASFEDMTLALS
jgi:shikimate dehydrogenase